MKKSEIAMLILIASISVVVAFFVVKSFMGDPKERTETIKTIVQINDSIYEPEIGDGTIPLRPINPVVETCIGGTTCESNRVPDSEENPTGDDQDIISDPVY